MPIFAVRTTAGRELQVAERIELNARRKGLEVFCIISPAEIKGYVLVEASGRDQVVQAVYETKHARRVLEGEISVEEVKKLLIPLHKKIEFKRGDIVEIIAGPFKGEKARIDRINEAKEELVVELLEATVPIPVNVPMDSVRIIQRAGE